MVSLAQRMNSIKPSPTFAMVAKAAAMRAEGKDIVSLSAGEPDYDTPQWIKEAAIEAMTKGQTKYTAIGGTADLKAAIAQKLKKDNGLTYSHAQIMASTGGKQVIFNALMATLNKGDEVIIPAPYWVSYPDIVSLFEGIPVFINCSIENNFKMQAEQLAKAITPKTKWLILNSPSNPTGCVYNADELLSLAELLRSNPHVSILTDDIYEYLVYDDTNFTNILNVAPDLAERTLVVNGVSKAYSMTGWRIGYGAGPSHLINAMTNLQSQSTSNPSSISQAAAIAAINGPHDFLNEWRSSFSNRRDFVLNELADIKELQLIKPSGAFYLYIGCKGIIGKTTIDGKTLQTDNDFCTYLLEHHHVATVSGDGFGLSPYFRISYATSISNLEKACKRIKKAIAELR
ncbi:MAG: pyridoxal phosphate-dependent aminotransferase [Proteobacteria bacterium]|nr:pyridoxal phosphate-dependent aminotransferase [Pseudomonadota bacterium]